MIRRINTTAIVTVITFACAAVAIACSGSAAEGPVPTPADRLPVAATIYPVAYFAERVGGERVHVTALIRPGVSAHAFEPTPDDMIALDSAVVVVYNSSAFEMWIGDALDSLDDRPPVVVEAANLDVSEAEEPREGEDHDHAPVDPHVWLDPIQAAAQVERIRDALVEADSGSAEVYHDNAATLIDELVALHERTSDALGDCALRSFVVNHRAFGHLAERYGLEQIAISGLEPGSEPGPQTVAGVVRLMSNRGIRHVLAEPIVSSQTVETVAAEAGAEVLTLHPAGSLTPGELDAGEDYFSIMDANLRTLTAALGCTTH